MSEQNQQLATAADIAIARNKRRSLIETFSNRLGLEPEKMLATLKATAFRGDVTNEQMAALLVVANEHNLNPFTKEIYAYPDKHGGIVPVVGVDGWLRIGNENPAFNGIDFKFAEELVTLDDAKACPAWMEVTIHRKDREHPTIHREYLDEVYRPPYLKNGNKVFGPWQTHTKRMLRWKTMIQGFRQAFSFSGIYDEDEAVRILEADDAIDITPAQGRKLVSPVKLRKVIEGLLAAVEAKDGKALWALINENEMTKDVDSARYIWGELRSWESRAISELMTATKQYRGGLDISAWSVELLQRSDNPDGLLTNWKAVQDAYAENDAEVPPDIETVYIDRKQALGVP